MQKEELKGLIIEHKEKFLSRTGLIARESQKECECYLKSKEIVLITGVRRGGKSSLMRLICDEIIKKLHIPESNLLYLNFEDERFVDFTVKDFELLFELFLEIENPVGRKYFLLDEIQNIKGWEKWVSRLYEFEDIKFFITGSNAALLSSDVSTALTGRNRQIVNWPFSFREFLVMRKFEWKNRDLHLKEKRSDIKRFFREYVEFGGFPEVLKNKDQTLLEQYFKDILYRDLIARYAIRNIKELKEVCLYLASNLATINSYENLKKTINAKSINTVKNYLESLENVFLFFRANVFDYSVKRQIYNPGKYFIIDVGLSQAIGFRFSENIGRVFENIVFLELKRSNKDFYYWKSKNGKEVDFVIRKGLKIEEAIQVCYDLSGKKTKERELIGLAAAGKELGVKRLTVLTEDAEYDEKFDGYKIKVVSLWKWLLRRDIKK